MSRHSLIVQAGLALSASWRHPEVLQASLYRMRRARSSRSFYAERFFTAAAINSFVLS